MLWYFEYHIKTNFSEKIDLNLTTNMMNYLNSLCVHLDFPLPKYETESRPMKGTIGTLFISRVCVNDQKFKASKCLVKQTRAIKRQTWYETKCSAAKMAVLKFTADKPHLIKKKEDLFQNLGEQLRRLAAKEKPNEVQIANKQPNKNVSNLFQKLGQSLRLLSSKENPAEIETIDVDNDETSKKQPNIHTPNFSKLLNKYCNNHGLPQPTFNMNGGGMNNMGMNMNGGGMNAPIMTMNSTGGMNTPMMNMNGGYNHSQQAQMMGGSQGMMMQQQQMQMQQMGFGAQGSMQQGSYGGNGTAQPSTSGSVRDPFDSLFDAKK